MGEPTQRFQRRTVLVKRGLQLKYAAIVFAAVAFTALIVGIGSYLTMFRFIEENDPSLMPILSQVIRMDMVKMIIFMGIMFLVSMFVSHRFAGPIYRFERSAQVLSTGDLTHRVALRTGDDLMELQDEVNAMIVNLQRLVQKDRSLVEHLTARLDETLKNLPDTPAETEIDHLRDDLKSLREELHHITRSFKV
ncbi:MAG: methyl-accepting chemotaxis protein [Elusimicrobiota bacterium]